MRGGREASDTALPLQASSSIGRASVSKTEGCGFDSCLACLQAAAL